MPTKPLQPCAIHRCPGRATHGRYCEQHANAPHARQPDRRKSSTQRGYGYRWQNARKNFLSRNPLCVECKAQGRITTATEVDHIEPHRGNYQLFWNCDNWQALCKSCHSRKTSRGE